MILISCLKFMRRRSSLFVIVMILFFITGCQSQRHSGKYRVKKTPCRECPSFSMVDRSNLNNVNVDFTELGGVV